MSDAEPEREDRRKKTCTTNGLGLAAAAIGVGVGAALYYFLSKRPEENRESGSSSSENWRYEQPQTFRNNESYSTVSEHTTTDTSINDSGPNESFTEDESETGNEASDEDTDGDSGSVYASDSEVSITDSEDISDESGLYTLGDVTNAQNSNLSFNTIEQDSDMDWDVTDSSLGVPEIYPPSIFDTISHHIVQVFSPNVRKHSLNQQNTSSTKFRERSWSLEECSICFDVMLKDQELLSLPCTHRFHVGCIGPWLEAQQTCPNCRKSAE